MDGGKIIFLHGASSSGKSTIACAVQARIAAPFWHISIDHLRDSGVLPQARFRTGEFRWAESRRQFFDGFHGSLAAYAGAGNNLVLEHILDGEGWHAELTALLAPFDMFFVGVHCPLPELIRREAARGDRPVGDAERDFNTIHRGVSYDFEVDSTSDAAANADSIIAAWSARTAPSMFFRVPVPVTPL